MQIELCLLESQSALIRTPKLFYNDDEAFVLIMEDVAQNAKTLSNHMYVQHEHDDSTENDRSLAKIAKNMHGFHKLFLLFYLILFFYFIYLFFPTKNSINNINLIEQKLIIYNRQINLTYILPNK